MTDSALMTVIAGLDPAIQEPFLGLTGLMDARVEPGHDEER
jgi:hypothetical protein